jgi:hypothetical protein
MTKDFYQDVLPFLLVIFSVMVSAIIGLVVWFYKLNETRMNSRITEIKELHVIIDNMKVERESDRKVIATMTERIKGIEKTQKEGFGSLESLIIMRMDFIEKLFNEKLKNRA